MTFRLTRSSRLPVMLEPDEIHMMQTLELQGRWIELEDYEKELREGDGLKSLNIEIDKLEELKMFLTTIEPCITFLIDFENMYITIMDTGRYC